MLDIVNGLNIISDHFMPKGVYGLMLNGKLVGIVRAGESIEAMDFDTVIMSQADFSELKEEIHGIPI